MHSMENAVKSDKSTRAKSAPTAPISTIPDRILRPAQAAAKLAVGKTSFYELAKHPTFPRAIILGRRARGYSERELDVWMTSQPRV